MFSQLSPNLDAYGKQLYSTGSQQSIATNFSITPGGAETGQIGLYVQISQGYINGEDTISLLNPASFPNIDVDWSDLEGKLTFKHKTDPEILYSEIEALVLDIVYESSSANPDTDKTFSITVNRSTKAYSWKIIPILLRARRKAEEDNFVNSFPFSATLPEVG